MQNKIKKHSPLKKAPLRQAGESLNDRLNEIIFDKMMFIVLLIASAFYLSIYDLADKYFNLQPQPLGWFITGILLIILYYKKLRNYWREANNVALGMRGERIVSEALYDLKKDHYEVLNDLIHDSVNIDHIIIGPAGVFTIETKTFRKNGDQRISYDGRNLRIDNYVSDKNYLVQANAESAWLQNFIEENVGAIDGAKVKPIIVFPGWYIEPSCKKSDVLVLNENTLPIWLENMPQVLAQKDIDMLSKLIGNYIRKHAFED